ncbi:MAG: HAD family hydrolase [bacterium]
MAKQIKGIFWDLDGTLVDTGKDIVNAINFTRNNFNLDSLSYSAGMDMIGQGFEKLLSRSLAEINPDQQTLDSARSLFIDYYHLHLTDHSIPYPGILNILNSKQLESHCMAVVTNKNIISSQLLLSELNLIGFFQTIRGGGLNLSLKPEPDMLVDAMNELNLEPDQMVMIGDSWTDILAARNAGIISILVCWGFKDVRNHQPDYSVKTADELQQLLVKLTGNPG